MPDLGDRANVMGPQPIAARTVPPTAMIETAERILRLLTEGNSAELEASAAADAREDVGKIARAVRSAIYDRAEIIGMARVNKMYFVKGRLTGADAKPFTVQVRLGANDDGRWTIREALNLTDIRSAWSK